MRVYCNHSNQVCQCLVNSIAAAGGMPTIHKASSSSGQSKAAEAAAPAPGHVQQALMGKQMLDIVDGFGRAPLHVAAAAGRVDVVQQLLFGGCDYTRALQADFRSGNSVKPQCQSNDAAEQICRNVCQVCKERPYMFSSTKHRRLFSLFPLCNQSYDHCSAEGN